MPSKEEAREHVTPLPEGIADASALRDAAVGSDVVVVPDRVHRRTQDEVIAGFRPDTQELRRELEQKELRVTLLTPDGARKAIYEEHAADWVLPVLFFASTGAFQVGTSLIANWISDKLGDSDTLVHYREARVASNGEIEVVNIEGSGRDVARVIRARGKASASQRH